MPPVAGLTSAALVFALLSYLYSGPASPRSMAVDPLQAAAAAAPSATPVARPSPTAISSVAESRDSAFGPSETDTAAKAIVGTGSIGNVPGTSAPAVAGSLASGKVLAPAPVVPKRAPVIADSAPMPNLGARGAPATSTINRDSAYALAGRYRAGRGVARNPERAIELMTQAAMEGHANAQYKIGEMLATGFGGKLDYSAAREWFQRAADQGQPKALGWLGWMYLRGLGVPADAKAARTWFEKAAVLGEEGAQKNLGDLLQDGIGGPKDKSAAQRMYEQALSTYRRQADDGDANAMNIVGVMLGKGLGARRDIEEAARWYKASADQRHPAGMANYGIALLDGMGVRKDRQSGIRYLIDAAREGNGNARQVLRDEKETW